jgi:hypothetical protein
MQTRTGGYVQRRETLGKRMSKEKKERESGLYNL